LEGLEDRTVPATMGLPIDISQLQVVPTATGNQLQGVVNFAGQAAGTATMTLATEAAAAGECPILDLHIDPIHLNLLGLHVDTSAICLDISAVNHEGLLGGLLCDLTGGLDLSGIIGQIGTQLNTLIGDLDQLLDGVLGSAMTVTGVLGNPVGGGAAAQQAPGACNILNLSLGPVELDVPLLGVNVSLDNCADGPVTVDVTGTHDGLLGNLLCGLADGLGHSGINLGQFVQRIDTLIDRLGDLAGRIGQLSNTLTHQVEHLIDRLEHIVDHVDTLRGLDRVIDQVEHVIDQLDRLIDHAAHHA